MINKKRWIFAGLLLVTLGAGLLILQKSSLLQSLLHKDEWTPLVKGPIVEAIYGLGTVTSNREFRSKLGVSATLLKVFVKEGDRVKKGANLLKLSEQLTVTAPFDGTIISIPYKEGENVFPQAVLLWMVDLKDLYLSMTLEQSAALLVRKGQKVVLMFESQRNQKYSGTVDAVVPKDGQFVVNILVDSLPEGILPGMTADTSVTVGEKQDAILIPLKAIQGFKVKFKNDGKVQKQEVKLGVVSGNIAELLEPVFQNPEQVEVSVPK